MRENPTPQKHEQSAAKQHAAVEWSRVKTPPHGFNDAVKVKSSKPNRKVNQRYFGAKKEHEGVTRISHVHPFSPNLELFGVVKKLTGFK